MSTKSPEDHNQDMSDGWVDGSCSELLADIFGKLAFLTIIMSIVRMIAK